jgi:hypothetical protein
MAKDVAAQNKTIKTAAMMRRKVEKSVLADDIVIPVIIRFFQTPHTVVAAKQVLIFHAM